MDISILVIEPDPMQRLGLRSALAAAGWAPRSAEDAASAMCSLRERACTLVLLGPTLPEADALAMAAAIRAVPGQSPAIVALSILPDCVIGHDLPGSSAPLPAVVPAILEALTRYVRFAPTHSSSSPAELERLVGDWADYESNAHP
ncbi:MAG: hypothetical protein NVSMB18_14070 [Acetobacteraceae bacterium]